MSVKEIDKKLKVAQDMKDRERKVAYIMSLAQYLVSESQLEQIEGLPERAKDKTDEKTE